MRKSRGEAGKDGRGEGREGEEQRGGGGWRKREGDGEGRGREGAREGDMEASVNIFTQAC
ncbi:hypothetical protein PUN28_019842 [Cardiocondyla obscurior]|uniref:Uncharacterized protein n=1 Tax=Cardiocondyla obscurior TaxID=286306 RepID=A0AAW2ED56_9HYME